MNPQINPKWTKVGKFSSVEMALQRYYKPDRLWIIAAEQVARITLDLARDGGVTILASRHESTTGRALWIHEDGNGFVIYQSEK